jgi:hypothetical protein
MGTPQEALDRVRANIAKALIPSRRLPELVFSDSWKMFLFFDSDRLFAETFVEVIKRTMQLDDATVCSIYDLDTLSDATGTASMFAIRQETSGSEYRSFLAPTPGIGWMFGIGRFACSTEVSSWVIYADRAAEMAVLAFRDPSARARFDTLVSALNAAPIAAALATPPSYVFSHLLPEWRTALLSEYGTVGDLDSPTLSPRQQIAAVAQAILAGSVEPQEGCRNICVLQHRLSKTDARAEELRWVVGIDSDLDPYPLGAARQYWEPSALAEKDRQRDEYLRRVHDRLMKACRALTSWQ